MNLFELHDKQMELESLQTQWTLERYHRRHGDKKESTKPTGMALMSRVVPQLGAILTEKLPKKGGAHLPAREWLRDCPLDNDTIAFITLKVLLSTMGEDEITLIAAGNRIQTALWTEIEVRKLQEAAPSYLWAIKKSMETQVSAFSVKHRTFLKAKRRLGIPDDPTVNQLGIRVGTFLTMLTVTNLGLFDVHKRHRSSKGRVTTRNMLAPSADLVEYLERGESIAETLSPIKLPMVLPPLPWLPSTDGRDGGYLTVRSQLVHSIGKDYDPGPDGYPPAVLDGINRIQAQPWRVNKSILRILETLRESNSGLAGLPEIPEMPVPEWQTGDREADQAQWAHLKAHEPEVLQDFKSKRRQVHYERQKETGKLIALSMQLKIGRMFKDYERIYFPHFLCSRGRIYPEVLFLNPQGDDRAKALLEFSEGKPLDTIGAKQWFLIHGANCFGYDKVSFGDRIGWCHQNHAAIVDSARSPLDGQRFWTEASSPFKFLAWAFEYERYHRDPKNFRTHCPVAMDGTCSGLQHYSALLRDRKGAEAVNLLHGDLPRDIYQDVATLASAKVDTLCTSQDVIEATERRPEVPIRRLARVWVGKVDRAVAKPSTMTNPYGVTRRGMAEQLRDMQNKGKLEIVTDDPWGANDFLADVLYEAVNEVVVSAELGKQWLRKVGNIIAKEGLDVEWQTPLGLMVRQRYRRWKSKKLDTIFGSTRIQMTLRTDETSKIDTHRATNGIAPNFIHSLDATHLTMTVNALPEDLSVCVIHDSFAAHAGDIDVLRETLKDTFVDLYAGRDHLRDFRDSLPELPEGHEGYPELPPMGSLDIEEVRQSEYLFS